MDVTKNARGNFLSKTITYIFNRNVPYNVDRSKIDQNNDNDRYIEVESSLLDNKFIFDVDYISCSRTNKSK